MENLGISITELAKTLGIGRNTAYAMTRQEGFPCIRLGRRTVVLVEGLREWLEKQAQAGQ